MADRSWKQDALMQLVGRETRPIRDRVLGHDGVAWASAMLRRDGDGVECWVVALPHEGPPVWCGAGWSDGELHGEAGIVARRLAGPVSRLEAELAGETDPAVLADLVMG